VLRSSLQSYQQPQTLVRQNVILSSGVGFPASLAPYEGKWMQYLWEYYNMFVTGRSWV